MSKVTVIKKDLQGKETWRYDGKVLERGNNFVLIEAYFNRADTPFHGIILKNGDRFLETFYSDRWYNIFEIYDREDNRLKGWYCNIGYPAELKSKQVSYIDLALDLWVYPDGRQMVLDQDEFLDLPLTPPDQRQALLALEHLRSEFYQIIRDSNHAVPDSQS